MSPVKKPTNPAGRVVRKKLTDGSIKVYRYDAYEPKPAAASGSFTVGELIAAWQTSPEWRKLAAKSRETYSRDIAALVPLSALPVAKLTRQHLVMVRNGIANGRGDGAAASFITAVGSLLAYGLDADWPVTPGISARLRKGLYRGELPAWTEADLQLALPHLPERLRRARVLAAHTGRRRSDLIAMGWDDYDGETIRLVQIKTGVKLTLRCPVELRAELDAWLREIAAVGLDGKPQGEILRTDSGLPWKGGNLSAQLSIHLSQILGFRTGLNVHGLRKLAAATLAMAGCNPHEIMAVTGHSTLAMIELYTRSVEQERLNDSAASKLAAYRKRSGS